MTFRLGKLAPRIDPRRDATILKLAPRHLDAAKLHEMPAAKNWGDAVPLWADPLYNDQLGDCTVAAVARFIRNALVLAGRDCPITAEDVKRIYLELSGGVDSGLYLRDVLDYAATEGICGIKIAPAIAIDHGDRHMLATGSGLGGGLIVGVRFPHASWGQEVWDVADDKTIDGGHAMFRPGHSPGIGNYESWGEDHDATAAWEAENTDEAYVSYLADAPPPSGLNLEALRADLALLE